jgi:hypothetical protein
MDHLRVSLGGNTLLTACSPLRLIIPRPAGAVDPQREVRRVLGPSPPPRDVKIRCNVTTSVWLDVYSAIKENNISVLRVDDDSVVELESIISELDAIEDPNSRPGSYGFAVVAGHDERMWLELQ